MNIERILMPTDFSGTANAALDHALFLAEHYGAELHLLHVHVLHDYDPRDTEKRFPGGEEILGHLRGIATSELGRLADEGAQRLTIHEAQCHGVSAADEIIGYINDNEIDLVVIGSHGRRGLRHALLGSTAEEVVRHAPCPVFSLRQQAAGPLKAIKKMVAPIDFSEHSRHALGVAKSLAAEYGASLTLAHVVERPIYPQFYDPISIYADDYSFPRLARHLEEALVDLFDEIDGPAVEHEILVREGGAASTIVELADDVDADLIVLATHGLTGVEHFLLGSVAEKVVRTASCGVLTLKKPKE
ncbi:MAG: universal stress protein [Acidobacteriota bacterium]